MNCTNYEDTECFERKREAKRRTRNERRQKILNNKISTI